MTEFSLDESVDISRVGLLYDQLIALAGDTSPITLELSNVAHIDCAGLQLIYAFVQDAKAQGIRVNLKNPSDALVAAVNTIGLAGYFTSVE